MPHFHMRLLKINAIILFNCLSRRLQLLIYSYFHPISERQSKPSSICQNVLLKGQHGKLADTGFILNQFTCGFLSRVSKIMQFLILVVLIKFRTPIDFYQRRFDECRTTGERKSSLPSHRHTNHRGSWELLIFVRLFV